MKMRGDACTDYHLDELSAVIERFREFAENNPGRMKQPGITRGL